jgi:hypothetical protein
MTKHIRIDTEEILSDTDPDRYRIDGLHLLARMIARHYMSEGKPDQIPMTGDTSRPEAEAEACPKMKTIETEANVTQRKPGRPRAISDDLVPLVLSLYKSDLGYRAIARELMKRGISVDWSTVRRVIKRCLSENGHHNGSCSNSDTILQRGLFGE